MDLIRGRWSKKWINCREDKRDYDMMRRGFAQSHEMLARNYCQRLNVPALSAEEKEQIVQYWAQYGIRIRDFSYHAMYYHVTGIRDPRFVPDMIAGLVIYEYYNDSAYEDAWRDKNLFDRLLPDVPFPDTYGKCIRNRFVSAKNGGGGEYFSRDEAGTLQFAKTVWEAMKAPGDVIVKNSRDSGFGRGVEKFHIANEADAVDVIRQCEGRTDFIIQKCIIQHPALAAFNQSSANMLRVCSWRHEDQVDIMYGAARAGVDGAITDVAFVDGVELVHVVGITPDGYFSDKMLDQDGLVVKALPKNVKVPAWDEIKQIVKKNHLMMDNFDIVGWDFTVDEDGKPKCFEWNIQWPGTVLYQYVNGPLYGDKTDEVLSFLKDKKNRDNYVPYYMWSE